MSKSSQRRGKRRPKPVISDPLSLLRPADPGRVSVVLMRFLTAIESLQHQQKPSPREWRDLSDMVNTVETLARFMGKMPPEQVMPTIVTATDAMVECADRFGRGEGMSMSEPGLEALRTLADVYRQCCEGLTEREMVAAQAETQRRVNLLLRRREAAADEKVVAL